MKGTLQEGKNNPYKRPKITPTRGKKQPLQDEKKVPYKRKENTPTR